MRYDYDMLGNRIHQASMEAGERWMLNDVAGKPIRAWDSRGHAFRTDLRPAAPADRLCIVHRRHGARAAGRAHRLRRRASPTPSRPTCAARSYQHFDQAGVVTSEAYDFKGNLLQQPARAAAQDVQDDAVDWSAEPVPLEAEHLHQPHHATTRSTARSTRAPHAGQQRHPPDLQRSQPAGAVDVNLRGAARQPRPSSPTSTTTPRASAR